MENKIDMSGNVNFIGTQEEWDALVEKNKLRLSAMKKQTAVQWMKELIECGADLELIKKSITKAHNIEMMQIFDAYNQGRIDQASKKKIREARTSIYYYVKTYFS